MSSCVPLVPRSKSGALPLCLALPPHFTSDFDPPCEHLFHHSQVFSCKCRIEPTFLQVSYDCHLRVHSLLRFFHEQLGFPPHRMVRHACRYLLSSQSREASKAAAIGALIAPVRFQPSLEKFSDCCGATGEA